jgi:hypothetical protein
MKQNNSGIELVYGVTEQRSEIAMQKELEKYKNDLETKVEQYKKQLPGFKVQ